MSKTQQVSLTLLVDRVLNAASSAYKADFLPSRGRHQHHPRSVGILRLSTPRSPLLYHTTTLSHPRFQLLLTRTTYSEHVYTAFIIVSRLYKYPLASRQRQVCCKAQPLLLQPSNRHPQQSLSATIPERANNHLTRF